MAGTVLDASALIAGLTGEPAQADVEAILREPAPTSISAVNLAEAFDTLIRMAGWEAAAVRHRVNWLIAGGLVVEPAWTPVARLAGELRARHYDRRERALSMADCICLATAIHVGARLATTDAVLAATARIAGVGVVALPNSAGQRA